MIGRVHFFLACLLALLLANRGNCLDLSAFRLNAAESDPVSSLLSEPAPLRQAEGQALPIGIRSDDDMVMVNFSPSAVLTPWFGAGLGFENPPDLGGAAEVNFGLGLDYRPAERLRFNLGWRYGTGGGWEVNRWLEDPDLGEKHRFSFGLETSF